MQNLFANIVIGWVRGTLHAINGVLFAKYLTMAWGFEAMPAAALSGATAGVWLMRGKIFAAFRSAKIMWGVTAELGALEKLSDQVISRTK